MDFDVSSVEALQPLADVISAVLAAAGDRADDVLLVGAVARDLHLHYVAEMPVDRITRDVDIAVRVDSWSVYDELVARFGTARRRHRVVVHGCQVDVVPFGGVERPPGSVSLDEDSHMTVLGHAETLATADAFVLPGAVRVRVPTPPALSVLKLLAWVDRGRSTDKDARDLAQLLGVYSTPLWNAHLYDQGEPHLRAHDYDVVLASVALLGAEASAVFDRSTRDAVLAVDRDRLVVGLTRRWFEPGSTAPDVARALDAYLAAFE